MGVIIKFHKTVEQHANGKRVPHVVQTVDSERVVDPTTDPSKVVRANEFLKEKKIHMVKGVYGAPPEAGAKSSWG